MNKNIPIEQQWKKGVLKDLCIDFDGVIHSYKSGWKGPSVIPDEPVDGAIEWLVCLFDQGFQPCIYSSRSKYFFGRRAMKSWLEGFLLKEVHILENMVDSPEKWKNWRWKILNSYISMEPWEIHCIEAVSHFVNKKLKFPTKKPPAYLTIDDRAICFNGTFPTAEEMNNFKPWYKK
jgi:hypothetical protein